MQAREREILKERRMTRMETYKGRPTEPGMPVRPILRRELETTELGYRGQIDSVTK